MGAFDKAATATCDAKIAQSGSVTGCEMSRRRRAQVELLRSGTSRRQIGPLQLHRHKVADGQAYLVHHFRQVVGGQPNRRRALGHGQGVKGLLSLGW